MKWIVFDCPSGIAGDMTLGALVDLGVPLEVIEAALATLPLSGYRLRRSAAVRHGIAATQVHVDIAPAEHHAHRHLPDILAVLHGGKLPERARDWAAAVFERLARAEAAVHRIPVDKVHFHEVGAVDAIVDIAGACVGLHWLSERHGVGAFRVAQLRVGRGVTRTEHGALPVPPPATLALLQGFPIQWSASDGERVTPTGAALLSHFAQPLGDTAVRIEATGYGAGTFEFDDAPNVVRLLLCEPAPGGRRAGVAAGAAPAPDVAVLTTTIDDMVPEFFGHLMEKIFAAGALDVYYTPIYMKKGRPATQVTVIGEPGQAQDLARVLLHESSTLGVRIAYEERLELPRRVTSVQTPYGEVQVKVAVRPDGKSRFVPEYESVRRAAEAAGVPLADVYRAAWSAEVEDDAAPQA
jgi:hypothetical protein